MPRSTPVGGTPLPSRQPLPPLTGRTQGGPTLVWASGRRGGPECTPVSTGSSAVTDSRSLTTRPWGCAPLAPQVRPASLSPWTFPHTPDHVLPGVVSRPQRSTVGSGVSAEFRLPPEVSPGRVAKGLHELDPTPRTLSPGPDPFRGPWEVRVEVLNGGRIPLDVRTRSSPIHPTSIYVQGTTPGFRGRPPVEGSDSGTGYLDRLYHRVRGSGRGTSGKKVSP